MLIPDTLQKGDLALLVSPAGAADPERVKAGAALLESWGLEVEIAPHALGKTHRFSAPAQQRLADLQWALDHPEAKAVLATRGGYGTTLLLDHLRWEAFLRRPRWVVGYSDLTALLLLINQLGVVSVHGPMAAGLVGHQGRAPSVEALRGLLFGEGLSYGWPGLALNDLAFEGRITGGNMSLLLSSLGTPSEPYLGGRLLFLEDVGEVAFRVERMLSQLMRSGRLHNLQALLLGEFIGSEDSLTDLGKPLAVVFQELLAPLGVPLLEGFPVGHGEKNMPVVMGGKVSLKASKGQATITYRT